MARVYGKPTRPLQLSCAITKELLDQLGILAAMDKVSPSYKAYQIIQEYVDNHHDQIQQYQQFMDKLNKR